MDRYAPLDDALRHARAWLDSLPERPVGPTASTEVAAGGVRRCGPGAWRRSTLGALPPRPGGDGGADGHSRSALLRIRHWRERSDGSRRRLAHLGLGPECRAVRRFPHGGGAGGDRRALALRADGLAARFGGGVRHRGPDGELHRALRRPPGPPPAAGMERGRPRAVRSAGDPGGGGRGGARHRPPGPALPRARPGAGASRAHRRARSDAGRRARSGARRLQGPHPGLPPGGEREHRCLRSVPSADRDRPPARGVGPRRRGIRAVGRSVGPATAPRWQASAAPTAGRWMPTSGSTFRTTRAWPSSGHRR